MSHTAFARIITIGKNSDLPRVVSLPIGVGVDGCVVRAPVTVEPDEIICPACRGWGDDEGGHRCERCAGNGIAEAE